MFIRKSTASVGLVLVLFGCQSPTRSPGVVETVTQDGIHVRTEVETRDGPGLPAEVLAERLAAYKGAMEAQPRFLRVPPGLIDPRSAENTRDEHETDPYIERGCPPEGSASRESTRRANRLKNRMVSPLPGEIDPSVTLAMMRQGGNDRNRWYTGLGATIEGYVSRVFSTGAESCNCRETRRKFTDLHLDITSGPDDNENPVIAEITPVTRLVWRNEGRERSKYRDLIEALEGKRVRLTGWLFYDGIHASGADNTDPGDQRGESPNWRATAWEIHPVSDFEILE